MSKTDFPLIKKDVGGITYEHVLVDNLPNGIIIGAAERNLYIDEYHEVNLCTYWNVRKQGTYEFSPEYNFYITEGRCCLAIYWNLGIVKDETKILKKFSSLEEASKSEYYKHFCWMKNEIDKAVQDRKEYLKTYNEYEWGTMWIGTRMDMEGGEYEWCCSKRKEYVQLKVDLLKDEWILTTSKHRVGELKKFIDDFEEINKKELHLLTYHDELDVKNLDESSPYYPIIKLAKEELGLIGGIVPGEKDFKDFKYIEYWTYSYDFPPTKILGKVKKRLLIDGTILISEMSGSGKILSRNKKSISPQEAESCYKNLAAFLSSGRLKEKILYGDKPGILKIKYKDGHLEKYRRGLSYKTNHLMDTIKCIL